VSVRRYSPALYPALDIAQGHVLATVHP
jgi:hypothetical protein